MVVETDSAWMVDGEAMGLLSGLDVGALHNRLHAGHFAFEPQAFEGTGLGLAADHPQRLVLQTVKLLDVRVADPRKPAAACVFKHASKVGHVASSKNLLPPAPLGV